VLVSTREVSPNSTPFTISSRSSWSDQAIAQSTGPKISSLAMPISGFTSEGVGST
jgi:hypothetical protein